MRRRPPRSTFLVSGTAVEKKSVWSTQLCGLPDSIKKPERQALGRPPAPWEKRYGPCQAVDGGDRRACGLAHGRCSAGRLAAHIPVGQRIGLQPQPHRPLPQLCRRADQYAAGRRDLRARLRRIRAGDDQPRARAQQWLVAILLRWAQLRAESHGVCHRRQQHRLRQHARGSPRPRAPTTPRSRSWCATRS
jgi:hypothetical protein